ncbi:hypothetical protein D6764_05725 [Candidatus Woesearchaeota archaeon]|nr:MAG: hypothetical protein D6764_05725 [Candidatus Woesearchaeota archaeon]
MVLSKKKELSVFFIIVLVGIAATLYFSSYSPAGSSGGVQEKGVVTSEIRKIQQKESSLTFEESRKLAEFLLSSAPTFFYDGIPSTLSYIGSINGSCSSCWNHSFSFLSQHPGYGPVENRGSAAILNFTSAHRAVVVMEDKSAKMIIIDDVWDDVSRRFIE